jgi:protoporphyrinogen oxidase
MHIFYESCIPEIDNLFTSLLPEDEWNILVNNYKDVAGVFINGKLQVGTPYVDLRHLPEEEWKRYASDIFSTIRKNKEKDLPDGVSAYEQLLHHFGKLVTDEIMVPIFEKLYLTHARNLDTVATKLTTVNRVALFDEDVMQDLMRSDEIRARICYPEQLMMPDYRTDPQRGFYPKEYGMIKVLQKFQSSLEKEGVRFLTSTSIGDLELEKDTAKSVTITGKDGNKEVLPIKELFWTAGLPPLAMALKIDIKDLQNDKKQTEAMYVNFLFDKNPEMGPLYHFFAFDGGYRSFRVTNYSNYCPAASENRGYPLCIEYWAHLDDSKVEADIIARATIELKDFGVIDDSYKILFSKVEKLTGGGFPLPSVRNIGNMNIISQRVRDTGIRNIIPTGVLSEKNVFFIKDVLIDTYKKVISK